MVQALTGIYFEQMYVSSDFSRLVPNQLNILNISPGNRYYYYAHFTDVKCEVVRPQFLPHVDAVTGLGTPKLSITIPLSLVYSILTSIHHFWK